MSFDAIGIISSHIPKSIQFYGLLGITFQEMGGGDHLEGTTDRGVRIMLDSEQLAKQLNPNWKKPSGCGIVLCFKQKSPSMVDEVYKKIIQAGFKSIKEPWDAFWGQRYSSVQDPDGNQVDIFASL